MTWVCASISRDDVLRDDIGDERITQGRDLILERELAALQARQLELIEVALIGHASDHVIEVAVLNLEFDQLGS